MYVENLKDYENFIGHFAHRMQQPIWNQSIRIFTNVLTSTYILEQVLRAYIFTLYLCLFVMYLIDRIRCFGIGCWIR